MITLDFDTIKQNPYIRAYAAAVNASEGNPAYNQTFGYGNFNNYQEHPRKFFNYKGSPTSAAGGYQIVSTTFDKLRKKYAGLDDFSPGSQDNAFIALLQDTGALKPLMDGDFDTAVRRTSRTWASLPFSNAGQPKRPYSFVQSAYRNALSNPTTGSLLTYGDTQQQQTGPAVDAQTDNTTGPAVAATQTGQTVEPVEPVEPVVNPQTYQQGSEQDIPQGYAQGGFEPATSMVTANGGSGSVFDANAVTPADTNNTSPDQLNSDFTNAFSESLARNQNGFDAATFNDGMLRAGADQRNQQAADYFTGRDPVNIVNLPKQLTRYISESVNRQLRG